MVENINKTLVTNNLNKNTINLIEILLKNDKKGLFLAHLSTKVLMVSFCECPMSVVRCASSTISLNIFSS